eukprot:1136784-Pelagomonas_calceolata.AAC.7
MAVAVPNTPHSQVSMCWKVVESKTDSQGWLLLMPPLIQALSSCRWMHLQTGAEADRALASPKAHANLKEIGGTLPHAPTGPAGKRTCSTRYRA